MGLNKQKRLFTISQSAFLLYDQKKLSKKMCLSTWYCTHELLNILNVLVKVFFFNEIIRKDNRY